MAANGEQPERALVLEFQQANGAFEAVPLLLSKVLHGGIGEGR